MPRIEEPAEPGRSFFAEVDSRLSEEVQLHCCGGFVATQIYGIARTTSDVDFLGVVPNLRNDLIEIGGKGSALHQKHKVYLDAYFIYKNDVTVAQYRKFCAATGRQMATAPNWDAPPVRYPTLSG